jgi:hypothetical protein
MQPWRNERGVVLPLALMALLVLGTVSAALLTVGSSEVQIAANHRAEVQAQFIAEAGLERGFDWLRANAIGDAVPFQQVALGGGNYTVQIQPAGANVALVVSTGTTTIGSAQRILRATMTNLFVLEDAILSGGDKSIRAQGTINGACGNIHTNGNLPAPDGNLIVAGYVKGRATTSGKFTFKGDGKVDGVWGGGRPQKKIPEIKPLDFWNVAKQKLAPAELYHLKDDGTILRGDGKQVKLNPGDIDKDKVGKDKKPGLGTGWSYEGKDKKVQGLWKQQSHDYYKNGTYFVEGHADLRESMKNWTMSLITAGTITVDSNSNPELIPHFPGTLFVAGGDIKLHGGGEFFSIKKPGLIAAHGKVFHHPSKLTILGAIIEEGKDSSYKDPTEITGIITYNCGLTLPVPVPGWVQILAWGP